MPLEIDSFLASRILIQFMSKWIEKDLVLVYADFKDVTVIETKVSLVCLTSRCPRLLLAVTASTVASPVPTPMNTLFVMFAITQGMVKHTLQKCSTC